MDAAPRNRRLATTRTAVLLSLALGLGMATLGAGPAEAELWMQGRLRVGGGYMNGTPLLGLIARDGWGEVRPELALAFEHGRLVMTLDDGASLALHSGAGANGYSNALSLGLRYLASPNTTLTVRGSSVLASLGMLQLQRELGSINPAFLPSGNALTLTNSVTQSLAWNLTPEWTITESFTGSLVSFFQTQTVQKNDNAAGNLDLAAEHRWRYLALGGQVLAGVYQLTQVAASNGTKSGAATQIAGSANATLRWDLTPTLNVTASAGASIVNRFGSPSTGLISPIGRVQLGYLLTPAAVTIGYTRSVLPSLLTGQMLVNDAVNLNFNVALSERYHVDAIANVSYNHAMSGYVTDDTLLTINSVMGDAGLQWQVHEIVGLGVRYNLVYQMAGESEAVPSLLRHTLFAGLTLVYPTQRPRNYSFAPAERVDGADVAPSGSSEGSGDQGGSSSGGQSP